MTDSEDEELEGEDDWGAIAIGGASRARLDAQSAVIPELNPSTGIDK
jgi:hypothetical protein